MTIPVTVTRSRRAARATTAPLDATALDTHLPSWDYADAYEVPAATEGLQARQAAEALLRPHRLGRAVLSLRDRAVRPLGIAPVAGADDQLFPVLHEDASLVVLGLDDRHLDFRILVQVGAGAVRCTTAVRRHGARGRLYFAVVGPFHRRLVPHLLTRCRTVGGTAGPAGPACLDDPPSPGGATQKARHSALSGTSHPGL